MSEAVIYVYDNNSTDDTAEIARQAGAIVRHEFRQGKGNVIRSMFREIDADCYLMVDGDDTYPADHACEMCDLVLQRGYGYRRQALVMGLLMLLSFLSMTCGRILDTIMLNHRKIFKLPSTLPCEKIRGSRCCADNSGLLSIMPACQRWHSTNFLAVHNFNGLILLPLMSLVLVNLHASL